ncbi:trp operon repressor [Patescibacteria group bacterium]|nr:trp operon repressor [Patescibacteria group bacterium]
MKIRPGKLTRQQTIETLDALYTAASAIKGRDAVKMFLRDLLTKSERVMLGRRILIAQKLLAGETQTAIKQSLGVGNDTIARVEQWLQDQIPGYEQALKKMEEVYDARAMRRAPLGTFGYLKRKYPLHFLFFPIPKRPTSRK